MAASFSLNQSIINLTDFSKCSNSLFALSYLYPNYKLILSNCGLKQQCLHAQAAGTVVLVSKPSASDYGDYASPGL